MKKICLVLLAALSLLLLACPALADGGSEITSATAYNPFSAALTVYAEPDTSSAVIDQVPSHTYVLIDHVTCTSDNCIWAYVSVNGKTDVLGWVQAASLLLTDYRLVVNPAVGDRLNLRATPSTDAVSLGKFYTGAVVRILDEPSDWQKVSIGGLEGYMMQDYLSPVTVGEAVSLYYDDMLPMVTILTSCTSLAQLNENIPADYFDAGDQALLLAVRDDGMALVKRRGLGTQDAGWVKTEYLTPKPSFTGYTSETNLMIVVNPDASDRLNLREETNAASPSLGKYYTGAIVTVIDTVSNSWALVSIGTENGYMNTDYLIPYTTDDAAKYAAMLPTVVVSNSGGTGLNLRSIASSSGNLLQTIPNGTQLTVLGVTANGYACVQFGSTIGYVLSDKLSPAITFAK